MPGDASGAFAQSAIDAIKATRFVPSSRDGTPIRSRIEYVVVFHPPVPAATTTVPATPPATTAPATSPATTAPGASQATTAPPPAPSPAAPPPADTATAPMENVQVRGIGWASPRGLGDVRVDRETARGLAPPADERDALGGARASSSTTRTARGSATTSTCAASTSTTARGSRCASATSPSTSRRTSRGRATPTPTSSSPRSCAASACSRGRTIRGRGTRPSSAARTSTSASPSAATSSRPRYGSFDQARVVGIAAPGRRRGDVRRVLAAQDARLRRRTAPRSRRRSTRSTASTSAARDHLRVLATAYGARATLPGVVRQDDVDAGRIGYYDAYPTSTRLPRTASPACASGRACSRRASSSAPSSITRRRAARASRSRPGSCGPTSGAPELHGRPRELEPAARLAGLGDLLETTNVETAAGVTSRFHTAPVRLGHAVEVVTGAGRLVRVGHTDQSKSLLDPANLAALGPPPRRRPGHRRRRGLPRSGRPALEEASHLRRRARRLPRCRRSPTTWPASCRRFRRARCRARSRTSRASRRARASPSRTTSRRRSRRSSRTARASARSTRAASPCNRRPPSSRDAQHPAATVHAGLAVLEGHASRRPSRRSREGRFTTTLAVFETWVGNELVFEAASGGLETESASMRRGRRRIGPRPAASTGCWPRPPLSVTDARRSHAGRGHSHYVPNIPPVLWRTDVNARGRALPVPRRAAHRARSASGTRCSRAAT